MAAQARFQLWRGIFAQLKTHFIQMGILYQETVSQKLNFYYELTTWSRISKCYITDSAEDGTSKYPWGNFAYIRPHNLFRQSHLCFDRIAKIIIILGYHHLLWCEKLVFNTWNGPVILLVLKTQTFSRCYLGKKFCCCRHSLVLHQSLSGTNFSYIRTLRDFC